MKKAFPYSVGLSLLAIMIVSCNTDRATQVPTVTHTAFPTSSNTPAPNNTFTPTPTPTLADTPYPIKSVIFNYSVSGWVGPFDSYLDWHWSQLVLYSDGQMIITGKPYQQKVLTPDEIDQFISKLEELGFFSIETNQAHDPSDPLYDFGDQYTKTTGGTYYYVTVNGDRERNISVFGVWKEFLVPEMKNVLAFLDEYQPEGMSIYYPDRILLHVLTGRNPYDDTPEEAIPWPDHLPSLEVPGDKITFIDEALEEKILYFEGDEAKQIYGFLIEISSNVFVQNNIEYTTDMQVVLPHNEVFLR